MIEIKTERDFLHWFAGVLSAGDLNSGLASEAMTCWRSARGPREGHAAEIGRVLAGFGEVDADPASGARAAVSRKLRELVSERLELERVGIPGDRLTSAPHRPAPPELEPAFAPRPLTPTEQLVWAASYAQYFIGGSRPADAARHATTCTLSLRDIRPETIVQRSKTDLAGEQAVAALEQMRGGR